MSIKLKTILGVALIEAILLALLVTLTIDYLKSTNYDGLTKRARTTINLFATTTKDAVLSYDLASLDTFAKELISNPDIVYVKILSYDGQILASAGDKFLLSTPFTRDNDVSLVSDGIFDIDTTITEGGENYGRIELGLNTAELNNKIKQALHWSFFIALGEMVLVALFSFLLGSYLTGQLSKLRQAAISISEGESDVAIDISSQDEISQVALAFNEMSNRLQLASARRDLYEKELLELNRSLENRVDRRTEQLSKNVQELRQTNHALLQTQERLVQSEKLASLGILAAGVAHEINNPVGFIMSNIRTLKYYTDIYDGTIERLKEIIDNPASDNEIPSDQMTQLRKLKQWLEIQDIEFIRQDIAELLSDTLEGTERIRDIVAGLHEFSSSDRDKNYKLCNLNEVITQTYKLAKSKLAQKADVITELSTLPEVMCNQGQIQQVLLNLMINAGQAIEEKGKIKIKSGVSGKQIFISVTDNGFGIPKAIQKKIFDPFFTTKEVGKGTGLGLSIAYGIMEEHKGTIKVKSEVGKGTRFTLYLPIMAPTPSIQTSMPFSK
jgi:two-component system, NtrC family, sensor kinase